MRAVVLLKDVEWLFEPISRLPQFPPDSPKFVWPSPVRIVGAIRDLECLCWDIIRFVEMRQEAAGTGWRDDLAHNNRM